MDDTLTVGGGTTLGADTGTAETTTPEQSTGTEHAASENNSDNGGSSREPADDAQQGQSNRRKWSMQDTVKELRAERRELRERLQSFQSQLEEIKNARQAPTRQGQDPAVKSPANFWQDPEAAIRSIQEERLQALEERMTTRFQTTRDQEYAQQALHQEQATGVEFIRSQKGYSPEDDEDLIEIIEENGLRNLAPMQAAKTAWALLQQSRGVGNKSLARAQAAGVQGQAPGSGLGRKTWSKAEFDSALNTIEKDPQNPKFNDLIKELESAHKEGRVK